MFEFMDLAGEVVTDKLYVGMHYQTIEEYFGQRVGFSWRALRRRLAIRDAVRKLDDAEQASARQALIGLGIHRAAILAPVIGRAGQEWQQWVTWGQQLDEKQLQERVSRAVGAKARGRVAHEPDGRAADEKWLDDTLTLLPEDARQEVADVFAAGLAAHETQSRFAVLLYMIREVSVEWRHQAEQRGWKPSSESAPAPGVP